MTATALILATVALLLAVFGLILAWKTHLDLANNRKRIEANARRIDDLSAHHADTKHRINEDLVELSKRLNRHREKLIRDYNRLLIIDQKLKEQSK